MKSERPKQSRPFGKAHFKSDMALPNKIADMADHPDGESTRKKVKPRFESAADAVILDKKKFVKLRFANADDEILGQVEREWE